MRRVLHESGLCNSPETGRLRQPSAAAREPASTAPDSLVSDACSASNAWAGPAGLGGPTRFSRKLDEALQLALQRAAQGRWTPWPDDHTLRGQQQTRYAKCDVPHEE
jgi:hypothetical protein